MATKWYELVLTHHAGVHADLYCHQWLCFWSDSLFAPVKRSSEFLPAAALFSITTITLANGAKRLDAPTYAPESCGLIWRWNTVKIFTWWSGSSIARLSSSLGAQYRNISSVKTYGDIKRRHVLVGWSWSSVRSWLCDQILAHRRVGQHCEIRR